VLLVLLLLASWKVIVKQTQAMDVLVVALAIY
jgi:hypothetical protein